MTALLDSCGKVFQLGRWPLAAAIVAIGLSGCASWKPREDGLRDNDLSQSARQARSETNKKGKDIDYWSFSEKGRQVERDLHAL